MEIRKEIADQLLLSKSLLERLRFQAVPNPDRFSLATHILTAHDAAELALAAIAKQCEVAPPSDKVYMMDYLAALKKLHPEREVKGRPYFNQLNRARVDIKHYGIIPNATDWARVADNVYNYIFDFCIDYLGISLDDLDESILLASATVKRWYDQARTARAAGKYREVLEYLAWAMFCLFKESAGLRGLSVGQADASAAIKLTGFGVHANDYLALQEFLPEVQEQSDETLKVNWHQSKYGHPGNWREDAASFCLETFLDVALKIQTARWIPGAIDFMLLYEQQVTAIQDEVEIWRSKTGGTLYLPKDEEDKVVVRRLKRGEVIRGHVSRHVRTNREAMSGIPVQDVLSIISFASGELEDGFVEASAVKVTCVPHDNNLVRQYFSDLPEIPWEPEPPPAFM